MEERDIDSLNKRNFRKRFSKDFLKTFRDVLLMAIVIYISQTYILAATLVVGRSMEPTLYEQDRVLINRTFPSKIKHGDIISITVEDVDGYLIKRVIGMPGDLVEIIDGVVKINEEVLNEPYLKPGTLTHIEGLSKDTYFGDVLSEGEIFVLGDNREESLDSRYFGVVPIENIFGKGYMIYMPTERLMKL